MMLFLNFIFEEREVTWLGWLERPLARAGKLDQLAVVVALFALVLAAETLADDTPRHRHGRGRAWRVLTYIVVDGLGSSVRSRRRRAPRDRAGRRHRRDPGDHHSRRPSQLATAAGKGRVLPVPLPGSPRRLVLLRRRHRRIRDHQRSHHHRARPRLHRRDVRPLASRSSSSARARCREYVYLEHGAHWAIGALAVILLVSLGVHVNEIITGLLGVVLIAAAFISSLYVNRKERAA